MFTPLSVLLFSKLCGLSEVQGRGERGRCSKGSRGRIATLSRVERPIEELPDGKGIKFI